ncbi:hypothetical protein ASE82_09360 [Sphingomonas sp. Leaf230]|uniref:hypothetical protein n=1 Tax=Sphingomonas sp. Leaf230 TaxID=1735694 RepID=UPI0006FE5B16|nr:hypothetical protein [Sphingomonas sp. Leaf230]KQN02533.1 hypothetical protein ASE82_09360 [Sphingomonas sp. Leaf230]
MDDIFTLTDKLERAMLKGTGFQISATELRVMIDEGIVDVFFAAKLRVLKSDRFAPRASTERPT